MSVPNTSKQVPTPGIIPPPAAKDRLARPTASSAAGIDQELEDWDIYYQLLLAGRLNKYGGEFIVIHRGKVIAHGANPDELRAKAAKRLGISADKLVVPFVDNKECIAME